MRFCIFLVAGACWAADLTGNWVVAQPNANDGTVRKTYFDLKQEGTRITGHIRVTQFYYSIKESSGGPDGFTLTGSLMDGHNERTVKYEGKLVGEELQIGTRRSADAPLSTLVAHRVPAGEGAYPARMALPALHAVPDNGFSHARRLWDGIVGTSSPAGWTMPPFALSPLLWQGTV